ncbi:MAG: BrnT family toxin [Chloroflexi bacterium]|nr:BrnT family toxin [Chloroflexota bacterium]
MLKIKFNWDPAKAEKNLLKYDVSFDEASTIFNDRLALYFDDVEHSQKEKREFVIGRSTTRQRLLTCFMVRMGDTVNIISARTSTHAERQNYDENSDTKHRARKHRVHAK